MSIYRVTKARLVEVAGGSDAILDVLAGLDAAWAEFVTWPEVFYVRLSADDDEVMSALTFYNHPHPKVDEPCLYEYHNLKCNQVFVRARLVAIGTLQPCRSTTVSSAQ